MNKHLKSKIEYLSLHQLFEKLHKDTGTPEGVNLYRDPEHYHYPRNLNTEVVGASITTISDKAALIIKYPTFQLVLPNVNLEISLPAIKNGRGIATHNNQVFSIYWEYPDEWLNDETYKDGLMIGIHMMGMKISLHNWRFVAQEVEPNTYVLLHSIYPNDYVHTLSGSFINDVLLTRYEQTQF